MELEDMQVIWSAQDERPLYVLDRDAVHAAVRRKARAVERRVRHFEVGMLAVLAVMTAYFLVKPIVQGHGWFRFVDVGLLLLVAGYVLRGRARRKARDRGFEASLAGELDKAIARVDYQVARIRGMPVWFMLPAGLIVLIGLVVGDEPRSAWVWGASLGLLLVSTVVATWLSRKELRCVHLPRKRELQALRETLTRES